MQLKIINSNSLGNAYILENEKEALLIECGVRFDRIKQALNFKLDKVAGCIVTHEHKDHCIAVHEVIKAGINVWASDGTHRAMLTKGGHRARVIISGEQFHVGSFKILPFTLKHDCVEPLGFLINHKETGNTLFLTDSYYSEYTFAGLNNILIEANYCDKILQEKLEDGATIHFLRDRVIQSHMSLATCKETLAANDLSKVNKIVLIHLSNSHSDAVRFEREVKEQTGKVVHVAEAGMVIDNFNLQPF